MPGLASLFASLGINRLDGRKGLTALLAVVCVLAATVVVISLSKKTDYQILYTDLVETDAAAVVDRLKELSVPYKLSSDGKTIEVPTESVPELRISFAAEGLPQGGGVGFEIFDKSSFGQSDFTQRINYIRARQGELERAIRALSPVQAAKVLLQIPEDSIYLDESQQPPTASVVVKLRPNAQVTRAEVRGIKNLVSGSVAGMSSEDVTVVDTTGRILTDKQDTAVGNDSSVIKAQAAYEQKVQTAIETMLESVLGEGRAVVRVSVEMDMDEMESKSETYNPLPGTTEGIIRNKSESRQMQGDTTNGGPAGIDGELTSTTGTDSKAESVVNYEISKREETVVRKPGAIKRVSVSVLVDTVEPARLASIREAVRSAAGLDQQRGDSLSVETLEFSTLDDTNAKKPVELGDRTPVQGDSPIALYAGIGSGVLLVLLLTGTLLKRRSKKKKTVEEDMSLSPTSLPENADLATEAVYMASVEQAAAVEDVDNTPTPQKRKKEPEPEPEPEEPSILDEIKEQIKRDPLGASLIIRTWLLEED